MNDAQAATEEPCEFADFNAKLLILDVLCYDLDVLAPYEPETDAFAEEDGEEEDLVEEAEGQDDHARAYYEDLDVLPSHLELITELTIDGELEIFRDLNPAWDGSDDRYSPQNWDDILDLPMLTAVYSSAPLPQHVVDRLVGRGVEFRSA